MFGIIKSVMGFRQFSMCGLEKVRGEWSLVTMAWNIKRMLTLMPAYERCSAGAQSQRIGSATLKSPPHPPRNGQLAVPRGPIALLPCG